MGPEREAGQEQKRRRAIPCRVGEGNARTRTQDPRKGKAGRKGACPRERLDKPADSPLDSSMHARIRRSICLVAAATALAVLGAGCKPGKAAPAGGSKRPAAPVLVATVAKTLYVTPVFYLYMDR